MKNGYLLTALVNKFVGLGFTGTVALCRHEHIGEIIRVLFERLANWGRPVCLWAIGGSDYRQGLESEPLGTTAFPFDRQRPVRCGRIPAFSRSLSANSALNSHGTFRTCLHRDEQALAARQ